PLLVHLQPPKGLIRLSIDRFSPYFDRAALYGIENLRAHPNYRSAFPSGADLEKLAYRFVGEYASGAHGGTRVIPALGLAIDAWNAAWARGSQEAPALRLNRVGDYYVVRDTRGVAGGDDGAVLDREEAVDALRTGPVTAASAAWIERKLGVVMDGV